MLEHVGPVPSQRAGEQELVGLQSRPGVEVETNSESWLPQCLEGEGETTAVDWGGLSRVPPQVRSMHREQEKPVSRPRLVLVGVGLWLWA